MNILPTSRQTAKAIQSKFYFTGKPCKHGHISKRYSSGACVQCVIEDGIQYRKNNPEKIKIRIAKWDKDNKQKKKLNRKKYYQENKERYIKYAQKNKDKIVKQKATHYQENKSKIIKLNAEYKRNNRDKYNAAGAKRHAAKLNRTPSWLSDTDKREIELIYKIAARVSKETGIPHHVDHEIPLQGELVSGLHIPDNLQLLTASENLSKGNSFAIN